MSYIGFPSSCCRDEVCVQVMDEGRAPKRNQSGSGRSKAVASDEDQARPGPVRSSGASSSSQLLGLMSCFSDS